MKTRPRIAGVLRLATAVAAITGLAVLVDPVALVRGDEPAPAGAAVEPTPSPALQEAIDRVARAEDEAALDARLAELRALAAPDFSDLVPQLALYLLAARGERAGMTPAVIVQRLGISRAQIERAIAPYRDTASPALRAQLENLLGEE